MLEFILIAVHIHVHVHVCRRTILKIMLFMCTFILVFTYICRALDALIDCSACRQIILKTQKIN